MNTCSCIYIDLSDGWPEWYSTTEPCARVEHTCGECGRTINKKEKYENTAGVWHGKFEVHKTCLDCLSLRDEFFCDGFLYGMLWEDFNEHIWNMDGKGIGDCLSGLTPLARADACEYIEQYWEEWEENEEDES